VATNTVPRQRNPPTLLGCVQQGRQMGVTALQARSCPVVAIANDKLPIWFYEHLDWMKSHPLAH